MNVEIPLGLVDMTNEQYHAAPGISKSHLDVIARKSPKHYWEKYINPDHEEDPKSQVFLIGQAMHTAILEPETMDSRVIKGLPHDRRSKANQQAWAEYELEHAGKIILSPDNIDHVRRVVDAIWAHPVAAGLLTGGRPEQSFFAMMDVPDGEGGVLIDHETGEIIQELTKCQTDYRVRGSHIVDLKSTEDASEAGFGKSCANYRYPVQQAWYEDVLRAGGDWQGESWAFLCFEKEPPYALGIYFLDEFDVARGRVAAERDYKRIVECRRANHWPDYGEQIRKLQLPNWMKL